MAELEQYLEAAIRPNTRRSYEGATRHFEQEWGGLLPATADSVTRYLADYAAILSVNTLRLRLAALSQWHQDHGFADPTRAPLVRQTLKGIRTVHPAIEKQAMPLHLKDLARVADWLEDAARAAAARGDVAAALRHLRDRAFVLLGFWRGFRGDELINLKVQNVRISTGRSMRCFVRSKTDVKKSGSEFVVPALSRWCPVAATADWIAAAQIKKGPVFRAVNRWGRVSAKPLHANSLIRMLRRIFREAGLAEAEDYSSHSLRRGFASWANETGWDLKTLMAYVGWKDINSAMRYLDPGQSVRERMETSVAALAPPVPKALPKPSEDPTISLTVHLSLATFSGRPSTRTKTALRLMEASCLAEVGAHALDKAKTRFRLKLPDDAVLEETIATLVDELHRVAEGQQCLVELRIEEIGGKRRWP